MSFNVSRPDEATVFILAEVNAHCDKKATECKNC